MAIANAYSGLVEPSSDSFTGITDGPYICAGDREGTRQRQRGYDHMLPAQLFAPSLKLNKVHASLPAKGPMPPNCGFLWPELSAVDSYRS